MLNKPRELKYRKNNESSTKMRKQTNLARFPDQFVAGGVDKALAPKFHGWQKFTHHSVATAQTSVIRYMEHVSQEQKTRLIGTFMSNYRCNKYKSGCKCVKMVFVDHNIHMHTHVQRLLMYEHRYPVLEWNIPRGNFEYVVGEHTCTVERNGGQIARVTDLLKNLTVTDGLANSYDIPQTDEFVQTWPRGSSGAPGYLHCTFREVADLIAKCPDIGISIAWDEAMRMQETIWLVLACHRAWDWVRNHVCEIHRRKLLDTPLSIFFIPNEHVLVKNDMITSAKAMSEHCSMFNCRLSIPLHGLIRLEAANADYHFSIAPAQPNAAGHY